LVAIEKLCEHSSAWTRRGSVTNLGTCVIRSTKKRKRKGGVRRRRSFLRRCRTAS
jgi:hypothetical protein